MRTVIKVVEATGGAVARDKRRKIQAALEHKMGVCLALEYDDTVGVLVDLIAVCKQDQQLSFNGSKLWRLLNRYGPSDIDLTVYTKIIQYRFGNWERPNRTPDTKTFTRAFKGTSSCRQVPAANAPGAAGAVC